MSDGRGEGKGSWRSRKLRVEFPVRVGRTRLDVRG